LKARKLKQGAARSEAEARRLLHELEVHQIELEMQNEELQAARLDAQAGLQRYTEIFDFAPIGYATLTPNALIRDINHAGTRLFEIQRASLVGRRFLDFVAPSDRSRFVALADQVLASEAKQVSELELKTVGASPRQLRVTATVLANADIPLILLAFMDITERAVREERIARSERGLREHDQRKNEFLAALSHELRNPLAPIRNSLFVLTRADPARRRRSSIVRSRTSRASSMTCSMSHESPAARSSSSASPSTWGSSCTRPWKTIGVGSRPAGPAWRHTSSSRDRSGCTPIRTA
jgi:PAS domain S-box-containing protein